MQLLILPVSLMLLVSLTASNAQNGHLTIPEWPELQTHLETYLDARRTAFADLNTKYGRALESQINQAAERGDLKLALLLRSEKARLDALVETLTKPPSNLEVMAAQTKLPSADSAWPSPLVTLRQTWESSAQKIREHVDSEFHAVLRTAELDLTHGKQLDKAAAVLSFREAFVKATLTSALPAPPEIAKPTAPDPAGGRKMKIPEDAVVFQGHSYKLLPIPPRNWEEARKECERMGGYLSTVGSKEEHEFVKGLAGSQHIWLGGNLDTPQGTPSPWRWTDFTEIGEGYWQVDSAARWTYLEEEALKQGSRRTKGYLCLFEGRWLPYPNVESAFVSGYLCEWDGIR